MLGKNIKPILLGATFLFTSVVAFSGTIYIDPTNSGDGSQDGSIDHPYSEWGMATIESGNSYLQKRGTSVTLEDGNDEVNIYVSGGLNNVTFGSYGDGALPETYLAIDIVGSGGSDIRVENILCRKIEFRNVTNSVIENLIVHDGYMAIILHDCQNIRVLNCEIYNMELEAIYGSNVNGLEIGYCYMHDLNLDYIRNSNMDASGDGIQFINPTDNVHIFNTNIDRTNAGNKFCIILSEGPGGEDGENWLIENSQFSGPLKTDPRGACLHVGAADMELRNNIFEDAPTGVANVMDSIKLYNNIIADNTRGFSGGGGENVYIYNNVFANNETYAIDGGAGGAIKNNIFYLPDASATALETTISDISNNIQNIEGTGYSHSVTVANPYFEAADEFNFHLTDSSPCINAGVDLGSVLTIDMNGDSIPNGTTDIGADEYYGGQEYNIRPVADYITDVITMPPGSSFPLYGNTSYDPDGNAMSFFWNAFAEVKFSDRRGKYPQLSIPSGTNGESYKIMLTVRDSFLYSKTKYITVNIEDGAAVPSWSEPSDLNNIPESVYGPADPDYVRSTDTTPLVPIPPGTVDTTTGSPTDPTPQEPQTPGSNSVINPEVNNLIVYPNPTNGEITVQLNSADSKGDLIVVNSIGKTVFRQHVDHYNNRIDLSNLSKGFYILQLLSEQEKLYSTKILLK